MKYIRSFLVIIGFGIFGVGAILMNFCLFPFIKNNKNLCSDAVRASWRFFVGLLVFMRLIKIDVKRLGEIKNKVIVSTHPSFIDILILISLIPRSTCFVKKELAHNPILKNIISSIFLTNELEIEELKSQTKKMLDMGFNVIIFPSGIRHRKNEYPKIKKGAALVAMNANKNIVPIKLFSSEDFLFIHQPFYAAGNKTVIFELEMGEEIKIEDYKNDSEIIEKKAITQSIQKALYGVSE